MGKTFNTGRLGNGLFVDANGNVGIGTSSPTEKLSVIGNIRIDNGAADGGQLVLASLGYSDWNIDNYSGRLRAYYNATEYFTITPSGNVGIGITNPFGGLSYAAGMHIQVISNNSFLRLSSSTYTGLDLIQQTDGNASLWNRDNGYIQVGTNNTARLTFEAAGNIKIETNNVALTQKNAAGTGTVGLLRVGSDNKIQIGDGGTINPAAVYIPNGNVGIGTSTPYVKLNVNGLAQFGSLSLQTSGAEYIIVGQNSSTGPDDGNCASVVTVHAAASGSPQAKWGYQFRQNDNSGANLWGDAIRVTKETGSNSTYTTFYTNSTVGQGTERMRITSGGVICMNTTTAAGTLSLKAQSDNRAIFFQNPNGGDGSIWLYGASNSFDYKFSTWSQGSAFYLYNNGNYSFAGSNVSDRRLKQNIQSITYNAIEKIMQLVPKSYNMVAQPEINRNGFIAQEVKEVLPDVITGTETGEEYLGLDYNGLLAVAIKAIQELSAKVTALENK